MIDLPYEKIPDEIIKISSIMVSAAHISEYEGTVAVITLELPTGVRILAARVSNNNIEVKSSHEHRITFDHLGRVMSIKPIGEQGCSQPKITS